MMYLKRTLQKHIIQEQVISIHLKKMFHHVMQCIN